MPKIILKTTYSTYTYYMLNILNLKFFATKSYEDVIQSTYDSDDFQIFYIPIWIQIRLFITLYCTVAHSNKKAVSLTCIINCALYYCVKESFQLYCTVLHSNKKAVSLRSTINSTIVQYFPLYILTFFPFVIFPEPRDIQFL